MMAAVMMIGTAAARTQQDNENHVCRKLTPEQMAKNQSDVMAEKLGLSQRQKTKLYDYDVKRFEKLQKKAEIYRGAMESARTEHDKKMQRLLTAEQYQKWSEMQK